MAVKVYALNPLVDSTSTLSATRQPLLFICDTTAELPVTGLQEGDLIVTKDTDSIYVATSTTTTGKMASTDNTALHPNLATHDTLGLATQAELDTHASAADPHTVLQRENEKGVANGYASLGADVLVPQDQLGTGVQDGTKFLRDDGTWQAAGGHAELHTVTDTADHTFPGGTSTFLRADGVFAAPTAVAADLDKPETGALTVATAKYHLTGARHSATGIQRMTVAGTGRWRLQN